MQALPAGRGVTRQLPLFAPDPESPRDVQVHAVSRPARAFTGDFYFTHRDGDRLWVVVGDVAGKGLQAAVVMGMIQEELEHRIVSCAAEHFDPAATMTRLDLFLRSVLPSNKFATVIIAQIRDDGTLVVANGGHTPLLIARRDGHIDSIGSTGPVVGVLTSGKWRSLEIPFRRGDTLLAYTDGVIEAQSDSGDEFGEARLRTAFAHAASASTVREVGNKLTAAVEAHAGLRRDDDLTMIIARR